MAQFCTKCGAPLAEELKFCTGCGATIGEPSGPAAQAPAAPAAAAPSAAPVATAAAAPAAKSGSPIMKIILIVVAVIIFLILASAGACVYSVYRLKQRVNQFQKQVHATFPTMPTGTREVHTQPATPTAAPPPAGPVVDTGVPVYPGATPWGGGAQVSTGTASMKSQEYTTSDSVDQVLAFYKDKLGPNPMITQGGGQAVVQVLGTNGETTVAIKPDASTGKTKISINTIGK